MVRAPASTRPGFRYLGSAGLEFPEVVLKAPGGWGHDISIGSFFHLSHFYYLCVCFNGPWEGERRCVIDILPGNPTWKMILTAI